MSARGGAAVDVQTGVDYTHLAWTGSRLVDVTNPSPDDIVLDEIAAGLARENRFGGRATYRPWSVAHHSILALALAQYDGVTDQQTLAAILMHDAPEYMIRDLPSPVKRACPDYADLEQVWWVAIATKFGLPAQMPEVVKHYDTAAFWAEKRAMICPTAGTWPGEPAVARVVPPCLLMASAEQAEREFMGWAEMLLP